MRGCRPDSGTRYSLGAVGKLREQHDCLAGAGGIPAVAQDEVDRALRAGEHRALRLLRSEQERNDGDVRCFSLGVGLHLVACGKDDRIFEDGGRKRLGQAV